jgi:hypothetical protein
MVERGAVTCDDADLLVAFVCTSGALFSSPLQSVKEAFTVIFADGIFFVTYDGYCGPHSV